ncbi:sodium channel protein Nach [Dendroctonus ponderosae]|nr:sodium channel protein Nach [Dendroctonus ponderosae]KAH1009342.1 hypothetical protein HUJ04_001709 [Dendroctonus ponderosae]KAH1017332.1 hypothetical protein HUJ05_007989 [Dendroctonus ponderosae]
MEQQRIVPNRKKPATKYYREFLVGSNVHGLYQIGKTPHILEKTLWTFLLIASAYYAFSLSYMTIYRYYTNPTVISVDRDRYLWTTYLPAITFCLSNNMNETALDEILHTVRPANSSKLKLFLTSLFYSNLSTLHSILEDDQIDPSNYLSTIVKLYDNTPPTITVSGQVLNTNDWLAQTFTEMGLCYCFNSPLAVYFSLKYQPWLVNQQTILPLSSTFELHPLDGEVSANIANVSTGFNVYIHGPFEVPDVRRRPLVVPNDHLLQVYYTALSIISSEDTKTLRIRQRKCRFYHESNLTHFPVYSYLICRMECRIRLALNLCGCVPHFYRKLPHERTCDVKGLKCLAQYKEQLISLEHINASCFCLANCEQVSYVVEEMDSRQWFLKSNIQYGIKNFPEMRFKRDIIFRFSDLLVYFGGVMGLFFGCSALSVMELIYYFTLRLYWFIKS